jgi:hypothetical protein
VDPALPAVRAEDQPVRAALLEQLHLVALVEERELGAAQLVGHVEEPDEVVADQAALATVDRPDEPMIERQAGHFHGVADRIGLAGLQERRATPPGHGQLGVVRVRDGCDRDGTLGWVEVRLTLGITGSRGDGQRARGSA